MAEFSTTYSNFFAHSFARNNCINLNFISMRYHFSQIYHHHHHHHPTSSSRHSILTFSAAALVNFLELKYQGKNESPFETHPRTMFLAIASLLLYCLAYDAKLRFTSYVNFGVCQSLMAFFGPLSLTSLFSILLPQLLCPVLFLLSILFFLSEMPFSKIVNLWKWMREAIWVENFPMQQQQGGPSGLVTVHSSRLLEDVLVEEDDISILPV